MVAQAPHGLQRRWQAWMQVRRVVYQASEESGLSGKQARRAVRIVNQCASEMVRLTDSGRTGEGTKSVQSAGRTREVGAVTRGRGV